MFLKQSTAVTIRLGPFLDDTDGKTAETALTINAADVKLWKQAGTTAAAKNDATAATHREDGYYTAPLNTTDTNTLGQLEVHVSVAGALPVFKRFVVLPANVYDSVVAGTDNLSTKQTATSLNEISDALLKRDWTLVTGEASRSVLNALRLLRNLWEISGSTLTVKREDDTTTAWTAALVTTAGVSPVTKVDPN